MSYITLYSYRLNRLQRGVARHLMHPLDPPLTMCTINVNLLINFCASFFQFWISTVAQREVVASSSLTILLVTSANGTSDMTSFLFHPQSSREVRLHWVKHFLSVAHSYIQTRGTRRSTNQHEFYFMRSNFWESTIEYNPLCVVLLSCSTNCRVLHNCTQYILQYFLLKNISYLSFHNKVYQNILVLKHFL